MDKSQTYKENKMIKSISIRTVLYLSIAVVLFLNLVNFVQFPVNTKPLTDNQIVVMMEENSRPIESKKEVLKEINGETVNKSEELKSSHSFVFFDYVFENNNKVIPVIYLLTMLTFLIQVLLLSWSNYYQELVAVFGEKKLDSLFLYTSEWTINAPPVLGVVGTIFSFGMVVSNLSDMSSLSTVFKDNFANAALTTIIGGTVYVLNLCINIFIAKNLTTK